MRTRYIDVLLRDCKSWQHATFASRKMFIKEMRGRQYGWDALTDAWNWFLTGWKASDQFHK